MADGVEVDMQGCICKLLASYGTRYLLAAYECFRDYKNISRHARVYETPVLPQIDLHT